MKNTLTAHDIQALGAVERHNNVSILWRGCAYIVRGFQSNGDHVMEAYPTLKEARQAARRQRTLEDIRGH